MGEVIELLGYFVFFWRFVFSSRYREETIQAFKDAGWIEKLFKLFEACVSTVLGLGGIVILVYVLMPREMLH